MKHVHALTRPRVEMAQSQAADTITLVISIISAVATILTTVIPLLNKE